MANIILDCDLMRFPNSGLYTYCLNLGIHVNRLLEKEQVPSLKMYVPRNAYPSFGAPAVHIVESKWHKYFKSFLNDCRVWHAPFQMGRIIPDKRRYPNLKVLLTIHDLNHLHEGRLLKDQRKSMLHTQSLIDKSDAIVCISEFTKKDVLQHCDVDNKPVYVIHNGVHLTQKQVSAPVAYLPHRPFLFAMGYVNAKKNFHVLLPLLQQNPELELVIAGRLDEHDYVSGMLRKAAEIGVHDRLRITGPVSEDDKSWYFAHCEAFMHPSLAEGFGLPVVEAMLFGKPVFLSQRTSLPEIGGDAAFYFPSFEAETMQRIFKEGMQQYHHQNMAAAIIARGKYFDWDKSAAEYLKVYQSLY
jgi:glycosyltransferase involved in cell wall biosynthesis